jgi:DNA repair protein RadC
LALNLQHWCNEVFYVLFRDSHNRLLTAEDVFQGTLKQTAVYPREVVRRAIRHNASAVILAHNHPSGIPDPSAADRLLTYALTSARKRLDIRVLDHVIAAGGRQFSFARHGLI